MTDEQPPNAARDTPAFDAWHPGLDSTIPARLIDQVTLYRPENALISYPQAKEIAAFCGLDVADVAAFKPERLVVHELLIRVTADYTVPDGPNYEDLGINLRAMVATVLDRYVAPRMDSVRALFDDVTAEASAFIEAALGELDAPPAAPAPASPSLLKRLFGGGKPAAPAAPKDPLLLIDDWRRRAERTEDPLERASLDALVKVVGTIIGKRGRLIGDAGLIRDLAARMVGNELGSERIGAAIEPDLARATEAEGFRRLPVQEKPVIMNVKGASAAGKSTIRPDQMRLAKKIAVPWADFAVISPDYWRKFLLDYDSLGPDYKYAAMLTGQELEIIDKKLDRYMAEKAARNNISHLLIDRFRFDSFLLEHERAADTRLLTRFGDRVFMFFMITAPEATIERAWQRGIKTGRYKAVDDLLHHNVEAYTGMPDLFFSWALSKDKQIHFEFLDNNVAETERPRTVAFGADGVMTILDVGMLLEVDRYRKVNLKAKAPEEVLGGTETDHGPDPARHTAFLERCAKLIPTLRFADYRTGQIYGVMENGRWTWRDAAYVNGLADADPVRAGLAAIGWDEATENIGERTRENPLSLDLAKEKAFTLGQWAPAAG